MAHKKPHPNSDWAREAREEDIQTQVYYRCKHDGPDLYKSSYEEAKKMIQAGKSMEEITKILVLPPHILGLLPSGNFPDWHEEHNRFEKLKTRIIEDAIRDALSNKEPVFREYVHPC